MYRLCDKAAALQPYIVDTNNYRIRLDANESFLQPTQTDLEAMQAAAAEVVLRRYPDPAATELCRAFAKNYGVPEKLVTAGNGSDELISVIFSAFLQKDDTVVTVAPDFSMYRFYAQLAEKQCVVFQKADDLTLDVTALLHTMEQSKARMLIFSNPCNPTSLGITADQVRTLIRGTDALVVLDEAYMDFWDQSLLAEVEQYDNLIILRTCSKALGLAALRIGFAVANPKLTAVLQAAKSPYNCDSVTAAMASVILNNPLYREVYLPILCQSRDMLLQGAQALQQQGLITRAFSTCTNFVFIEMPRADAVFEDLKDCGILVRCFGDRYLRITAGTESENREVLAYLKVFAERTMNK